MLLAAETDRSEEARLFVISASTAREKSRNVLRSLPCGRDDNPKEVFKNNLSCPLVKAPILSYKGKSRKIR